MRSGLVPFLFAVFAVSCDAEPGECPGGAQPDESGVCVGAGPSVEPGECPGGAQPDADGECIGPGPMEWLRVAVGDAGWYRVGSFNGTTCGISCAAHSAVPQQQSEEHLVVGDCRFTFVVSGDCQCVNLTHTAPCPGGTGVVCDCVCPGVVSYTNEDPDCAGVTLSGGPY